METMKTRDLRDTKKALENKMMLDTMQIDSQKWPTLLDLNAKVDANVVLPQTILNYGEYQTKLQNLAFYAEQGDHESMQRILDKEDVMDKKNLLLQPIFRDLKSIIKHMTYTEEYKILKEYLDNRTAILNSYPENTDKCKKGLAMLEQEYAKLLKNYKKQFEEPSKKLKILQKRLEDMFQLLNLWTQYVEVIYMPEGDIHVLDSLSKTDARPEDASYGIKTQQREMDMRIKTLFGKDVEKKEEGKDEGDKGDKDEEYETVNEGMTTDTTEAP